MLKHIRGSVWGFVVLVLFPPLLAAQNFVYTNNDQPTGNTISAFSVDTAGTLTELGGSPFATGGTGTASTSYYPNRIIVVKGPQNDFLYASNAGGSSCYAFATVSAFNINASSGALSQILPLPDATCTNRTFPTDGFDGIPSGVSLAATPDGKYLFAGTTGIDPTSFSPGTITIFSINTTAPQPLGQLSVLGSVPAGGAVSSMTVTPQKVTIGQNEEYLLAVSLYQSNEVAMFEVKSDGTLTELPGSPLSTLADPTVETGSSTVGIEINCASNLLFAGRAASPYVDVFDFSVDSTGALTATGLTPVLTNRQSNQVVILNHHDDGTPENALFSSNPGNNTVTPFAVDSNGNLTQGLPVGAGTGAFNPGGLSLSQHGELLYAGNVNGAISTFSVDTSSSPASLTLESVKPTGQSTGLHSVAAYPANACFSPPPPSNNLAVSSLKVSGGPPPAFELEAILTLEDSLGANPFLDQSVTIEVGDFALTLPAGSFKAFREGRNAQVDLFQGVISGTTLKVEITPLGPNELGQNQFQIYAFDKQVNLVGLDSAVTVTIKLGAEDNSPSVSGSVTPTFPSSLRGNWRDF